MKPRNVTKQEMMLVGGMRRAQHHTINTFVKVSKITKIDNMLCNRKSNLQEAKPGCRKSLRKALNNNESNNKACNNAKKKCQINKDKFHLVIMVTKIIKMKASVIVKE